MHFIYLPLYLHPLNLSNSFQKISNTFLQSKELESHLNVELQHVSTDAHDKFIKYITVAILALVTDINLPKFQDTENTEADKKCD